MTDLLYVPGGPIPWDDEAAPPAEQVAGGLDILDILSPWPPFGGDDQPTATVDLGRFRIGDTALLTVATTSRPDDVPYARIATANDATLGFFHVADIGASYADFSHRLFIDGARFSVGRFLVIVTWAVSGAAGRLVASLEVVAGGDPAGRILAITASPAKRVLVQSDSGLFIQGTNPRL